MQIINGYLCRDCTDVARAKKGVDPAHPEQEYGLREQDKRGEPEPGSAGALAESGDVGTRLHVIA